MAKVDLQLIPYGGVHGETVGAIVGETCAALKSGHTMNFVRTYGDSLLPRRRSIVLTEFWERGSDAIVTVDHDVKWNAGAALGMALKAIELNAIVGGLYCKRVEGNGWASRLKRGQTSFQVPDDRIIEAEYVGSGFMAIPRSAVEAMLDDIDAYDIVKCYDGKREYFDFYHTMRVPHPDRDHCHEYLSEDWALCERAKRAGVKLYIDLRPQIVHFGERGFNVGDGAPKPRAEGG